MGILFPIHFQMELFVHKSCLYVDLRTHIFVLEEL